ncbi:hypothetical protein JQX13_34725 [Archangium violaceum]|uniref:hypothetical protein n=1 Tax=Archangium violaceum TaxID=83451 RepID=UPI00193C4AEA|nr:hypothetical protein [Archangium violaceum]QRK05319.1 hypothetical protein JQX13_34725 [Archangium violaceum]
MSFHRRHLPWSLALLLSVTAAIAAESVQHQYASDEQSSAEVSAPEQIEGLVCLSVRCITEDDCWNACPTATSVSCTRNACSYTTSGGGGGGGGGPLCPATRCIDDSDCSCNGSPGVCVNRACAY